MATTRRQSGKPGLHRKPFSFMDRLKEIGMFFQKREDDYLAREG